MQRFFSGLLILLIIMIGCSQEDVTPTSRPSPTSSKIATAVPINTPVDDEPSQSSSLLAELIDLETSTHTWPAPMAPLPPLVRTAVTPAQQATLEQLQQPTAPDRDDFQLALAYRRLQTVPTTLPPTGEDLTIGAETTFNITQSQTNEVVEIEANLLGVSEHGYFWFDNGTGSVQPGETAVADLGIAFDEIYESVQAIFGDEPDAPTRVHVVTVSPLALCNVTLKTIDACGLAGYFDSAAALPKAVNPLSNERDMFVMNADWFGTEFYLNVLGHELRHLIENNYDPSDEGWEIEGSAALAEDLLDFPANALQRGNRFLKNPNLQLNSWVSDDKIPQYGQGYLLNRYIYDQLGADFYRDFSQHPANGLAAIDAVAADHDLTITGEALWLDWLAALAIHNHLHAPPAYQFDRAGLSTAFKKPIRSLPATIEGTVSQYGANYYRLPIAEALTIDFTGSTAVPLLPVLPASGQMMWLAERGNFHNPRLTRTVDLTNMEEATLTYSAYVDMDHGYDFGYVSVSTDNGRSWQPLTAPNMQGQQPTDDPARTALADRFYTGRTQDWLQETIDLTPYVGQPIQLRFEYVTNSAVNHSGFALDNIAIPEIGFYDDAESLARGWLAAGFTRATAYIPQTWHLQLISFPDGIPNVTQLPVRSDQSGSYLVETQPGDAAPLLIIAATAPNTLEPAFYQLKVNSNQ